MYGQGQFYRHVEPLVVRREARAAHKPVCHERPGVNVFLIVVCTVLGTVNALRRTSPLRIVTRSFEAFWQSACLAVSSDKSHSSAKAYSISCHYTLVCTFVCKYNTVGGVAPLAEIKCPKIHPCTATHTLIDTENGAPPLVIYNILGIGDASFMRRIAYVNGIFATLGEPWLVGYLTFFRRRSRGHARRTVIERVFVSTVFLLACRKPSCTGVFPFAAYVYFCVIRQLGLIVVVYHHFVFLPVALARREHYRPCILEHGDEVGHYYRLREQVLVCTEHVRALPFPYVFVLVVIPPVAGPDGQMLVLQSACDVYRF